MAINFEQIKKAVNVKKTEINKLNEDLDSKINKLLALVDKEAIAQLKHVLGNENNHISDALRDELVENADVIQHMPKLTFRLCLDLPAMEFNLINGTHYLSLSWSSKEVWYFWATITSSKRFITKSIQSPIAPKPIVFDTAGIDLDFVAYTYDLFKTKYKCRKTNYGFLFDISKRFDMEKYVDIIRDAFSELGFRSVEVKHDDPSGIYDQFSPNYLYTAFKITVDNPLYEEE